MKQIAILICLITILSIACCTSDETPSNSDILPLCSLSSMDYFREESISPTISGYEAPTLSNLDTIRDSISSFLNDDYDDALSQADRAGYFICSTEDSGHTIAIWYPQVSGTGNASWAIRMGNDISQIIVEAPHGFYDDNTLEESVLIFQTLQARALIVTGANRCSSSTRTDCSGTSLGSCGNFEGYYVSDMAHTTQSFFQAAHESIANHFLEDWVISVHGFDYSGIHLSDGTSVKPLSKGDPSALFIDALREEFPDMTIASCNNYEDASSVLPCIGGSTNVQARHTNDSSNPCYEKATTTTKRFIHLEQSKDLRIDKNKMAKVVNALFNIVPRKN